MYLYVLSEHSYISFRFTSIPFCLWTSLVSSNFLCAWNTFISSMEKRKLSLWRYTLPVKCQALRPEYQLLLFDVCCWTTNNSSSLCCCHSSNVQQGPLSTYRFLRRYSCAMLVHYHFCWHSLSCKQALIFKEASPSRCVVLNHM